MMMFVTKKIMVNFDILTCTDAVNSGMCAPKCKPHQCCQRDGEGNYRCFCLQEYANNPGITISQVGVIVFSTGTHVQFKVNTRTTMMSAVNSVSYNIIGSGTN